MFFKVQKQTWQCLAFALKTPSWSTVRKRRRDQPVLQLSGRVWGLPLLEPPEGSVSCSRWVKSKSHPALTSEAACTVLWLGVLFTSWTALNLPRAPCRWSTAARRPSALVRMSATLAAWRRQHVESCVLPSPSFLSSHVPCRSPQGRKKVKADHSYACAGWCVAKHACMCIYIHVYVCLSCQVECRAAVFFLSGSPTWMPLLNRWFPKSAGM